MNNKDLEKHFIHNKPTNAIRKARWIRGRRFWPRVKQHDNITHEGQAKIEAAAQRRAIREEKKRINTEKSRR